MDRLVYVSNDVRGNITKITSQICLIWKSRTHESFDSNQPIKRELSENKVRAFNFFVSKISKEGFILIPHMTHVDLT